MKGRLYAVKSIFALLIVCALMAMFYMNQRKGTAQNPVLDSVMTLEEALEGLHPDCPKEIKNQQVLIDVTYYGLDQLIHQGQIVLDRDLRQDIKHVFQIMLKERFPLASVIPVSDPKFRSGRIWDDELSMAQNNTSGFNYRFITGQKKISEHALGHAIDINPLFNPYIKGALVLPTKAVYDMNRSGTLYKGHPVVKTFKSLGWTWGGDWVSLKDYQHFEKKSFKNPG